MIFLILIVVCAMIMVILSFISDKDNEYDVAEPNRKNDYSIAMNANTHRQIVIPDWVDIDGVLTNIKDYEKVFVEGNRLGYRGIHSDDLCVLSKTKPTFFKKRDIVLLNDATLWEVKIAHKNGKYTLTKQDTPNRIVSYDEIKNKVILAMG